MPAATTGYQPGVIRNRATRRSPRSPRIAVGAERHRPHPPPCTLPLKNNVVCMELRRRSRGDRRLPATLPLLAPADHVGRPVQVAGAGRGPLLRLDARRRQGVREDTRAVQADRLRRRLRGPPPEPGRDVDWSPSAASTASTSRRSADADPPCLEPRCPNPATARGRCDEHRKPIERERSRARRAATNGVTSAASGS